MLNKMINALEGAKLKLEEHDSEIGGICADIIDVMNRLDLITVNYSEVVFTENAIDKVMYGVMKESDDYFNFELKNKELMEWLSNQANAQKLSSDRYYEIIKIYEDYFINNIYNKNIEPKFLFWNCGFEELVEEIDKTINTLKSYLNDINNGIEDEGMALDKFFQKYDNKICTVRELQNDMNKVTRDGVENDFEGLYGGIGEDFKEQLTKYRYFDYAISDDELGVVDFELIKLDEDDLSNSRIKVTGFLG